MADTNTKTMDKVEVVKAAGAKAAWHGPMGGQHIMGGTIMGSDREKSVTNGEAQTNALPEYLCNVWMRPCVG